MLVVDDEELHLLHELAGIREHVEAMDSVRVLNHPDRLPLHLASCQSLSRSNPPITTMAAGNAGARSTPSPHTRAALRQELPPEMLRPRHRQRRGGPVERHLRARTSAPRRRRTVG
jgi:hypothetical protein